MRVNGIVCMSEPQAVCWACDQLADFLCDHPVTGGTCDAAMCPDHAAVISDDVHHCGAHYRGVREASETT